jgi:hypothetical protein
MELKQKKSLEPMEGNPFVTLQFNNLNEIGIDVNLKFGTNSSESKFIIDNLIQQEQKNYGNFVEENPESSPSN